MRTSVPKIPIWHIRAFSTVIRETLTTVRISKGVRLRKFHGDMITKNEEQHTLPFPSAVQAPSSSRPALHSGTALWAAGCSVLGQPPATLKLDLREGVYAQW